MSALVTRMSPEGYQSDLPISRMMLDDYDAMRQPSVPCAPPSPALLAVFTRGQFFNPAKSHHPDREGVSVVCDRCSGADLQVSVGFEAIDLCMACMAQLEAAEKVHEHLYAFRAFMLFF